MARLSPIMAVPLVLFAIFAGLALIGLQRENPNELPSALVGRQAPAVRITPLGDKPIFADADLRAGEVSLVNYWASWCAPCRVEHPKLMQFTAESIPVYGINYKDTRENALRFLDEMGDPYAALGADESGRMAIDWGVYGVPETYVIDGRGNIVARFAGPITDRVLNSTIRPAIEEARAR